MPRKKVLITGMSGLIGDIARKHLDGKYALTALNRRPVTGVPCHQADIADLPSIEPAFHGQDVVVHLAAKARGSAGWEELLDPNVLGVYNVFEASRRAGVKRVIYASSGATVSGWEREHPYSAIVEGRYDEVPGTWPKLTHESPVRPGNLYGCTKAWGEALARHFSDAYKMSMICLRIGAVTPDNRPTSSRTFSVWCSHRDIAQMIEKCIEAPDDVRFDIFFVVSNNKWSYRDVSHPRMVVGYQPLDTAPEPTSSTDPHFPS
jgi:nucleoside-diphosphate-sugar epimerase